MCFNTGTTARMSKGHSRCWLAANFRADWNCPSCNWEWQAHIARFVNTKPDFSKAPCKESSLGSPHWLKLSLQGWLSRTVSTMMQRASIRATSPLAATSVCTGSACAVHGGGLHRWKAAPNNCVRGGHGCPVCADLQACVCNSLQC